MDLTLTSVLNVLNLILSATNLILSFSLVIYILTQNLTSTVSRTFAALMALVAVVYGCDVILMSRDLSSAAISAWLRFQWLGIAMVPATYLHFSDALLRMTNASSARRRWLVATSYGMGALFFLAAFFTSLVVRPPESYGQWSPQLVAGGLFWLFGLYFFMTSAWGFANTLWARSRALTPTSRRRLTYLVASFAAPGLAVYPYLVIASVPDFIPPALLLAALLAGNLGVALLTIVMAYSVAYQGALAPDRVIRRSFVNFLLRGPFLGLFVLAIILIVPRVEVVLGVPRETILIFAVVGGIIFYQVLLRFLRPLVDLAAYTVDREEVEVLRTLEERLLTSSDLQQLLENILTAVCDLQRARTGAVVSVRNGSLHLETACGDRVRTRALLQSIPPSDLAGPDLTAEVHRIESWIGRDSFRFLPLRADDSESTLGFLVVEPGQSAQPLNPREQALIRDYVQQAELALQDRALQQGILALLRQLSPQIERLQEWRSAIRYPAPMDTLEGISSPVHDENFTRWVRDALGHYWGGPRLSESPLLSLNVVREKLGEHDNNAARALRAVITEGLDALRPPGEREMTTQEWLLYNILDLKYVQGRRARDVAMSLAMSESDLYRKQRAAIEELAKAIGSMENGRERPPGVSTGQGTAAGSPLTSGESEATAS